MGTELSTRERILQAAISCLAERGFSGSSLASIAAEAGVSKQVLIHHFRSKEGLREAVMEHLEARWMALLPQLIRTVSQAGDFESAMEQLVEAMVEEPLGLRLVIRELLDRPEAMRAWLERTWWPWMRLVSSQSLPLGEDAPEDLEAHLSAAGGLMLFAIAIPPISRGDGDPPELWRRRVIRAALKMIQP